MSCHGRSWRPSTGIACTRCRSSSPMLQTQLVIGSITTGAGKLVNTWVLATIDSLPRDQVRQTGNTGGNFGFWATYCLPDGTLLCCTPLASGRIIHTSGGNGSMIRSQIVFSRATRTALGPIMQRVMIPEY